MRDRGALRRGAAWLIALVVAVGSCVDLFHSTSDLKTLCELDAAACGACAASPEGARRRAEHACAWLAACETPTGRYAAGSCMFQALLAYDCASNPNHAVKGDVRDSWACLAGAASCGDVARCIRTDPRLDCRGQVGTACMAPQSDASPSSIRLVCGDSGLHAEDCALWGLACESGGAACSPARSEGCDGEGGVPTACAIGPSSAEVRCSAGGPLAYACSNTGLRACAGYPAPPARALWIACVPETVADASCNASLSASCDGGVASLCPSGAAESINCEALLGQPETCTSQVLSPPYDWTSPCAAKSPGCTEDTCLDGGPDGSALLSACVRGAPMVIDCAAQSLRGCGVVNTEVPGQARPACGPP